MNAFDMSTTITLASLRRLWEKAVAPSAFVTDPASRYRVRFLNAIIVVYHAAALLVLTLQVLILPLPSLIQLTSFKAIIMGMGASALLYCLNHTRYYPVANYLAVITTCITIIINAIASGAPHLQLMYIIVVPMIGMLLLSALENAVLCVLSVVALVFVVKLMGDVPDTMLVDMMIVYVLTTAVMLFVSQQRDRLEAERRQSRSELEKARIAAQFIQDVSHEFRTPLSIISTGVYLLGKMPQPEARQERVDQIQTQISAITQLLEDILTITRLDSQVVSAFVPVALDKLVQEVVDSLKPEAQAKGLNLDFTSPAALPTLQGNSVDLQLAVKHLLNNAIHFTARGGIHVRLLRLPSGLCLDIQDTGIGIPAADLTRVFDRFYRVDQARTTRGAGLGLTIAKKIVENHQGTITVESEVGKGSRFRLTFPLNPAAKSGG